METLRESSKNMNKNRKKSSKITMLGNIVTEVGAYLINSCNGGIDASSLDQHRHDQHQQHHKHRKLGVASFSEPNPIMDGLPTS